MFFLKVLRLHFLKVVEVIGAFRIYTFVDNKVFSVFFRNKSVSAMRAMELNYRKTAVFWRKSGITDFAEDLPFGTIVFVKIDFGGITPRVGTGIRDITI